MQSSQCTFPLKARKAPGFGGRGGPGFYNLGAFRTVYAGGQVGAERHVRNDVTRMGGSQP